MVVPDFLVNVGNVHTAGVSERDVARCPICDSLVGHIVYVVCAPVFTGEVKVLNIAEV